MAYFGKLYLDEEKDMIVDLFMRGDRLFYAIRTPNHGTGNLISNLGKMCGLPVTFDENGLKTIKGEIPAYIDQYNNRIYIFRLGNTKVANVFPDGRIEMKASIPAISKTLMSQTKDYRLDISRTIVKSYIFEDVKFRSDLHTHMNANLPSETLMALGIVHHVRYPLYYIKKLELRLSASQEKELEKRRKKAEALFSDSPLRGRYRERKIDDNTFIDFASLILDNLRNAAYNIQKISNSLCVQKDGQAVFTNLEKVYLYRYVFTKGISMDEPGNIKGAEKIPDDDVREKTLFLMELRKKEEYSHNTLYQDKLYMIADEYRRHGISYAEISDTSFTKREEASEKLAQIHEVMPFVYRDTGVMLRFLAAMRRIPLTIVKDSIEGGDYLSGNIRTLRAVAEDPYIAGSDFVGEEITDITSLKDTIAELTGIAEGIPSFVIRIHAGENDSLRDNVKNSILLVRDSLKKGQKMPHLRIGHGLYTVNLRTPKGKELIKLIKDTKTVLEFQITSNVRLNNLNQLRYHPIKEYLKGGVRCVEGTDGGALYGTNSIEEELALEKFLDLTHDELMSMKKTESEIIRMSKKGFYDKEEALEERLNGLSIREYYEKRLKEESEGETPTPDPAVKVSSQEALSDMIEELPSDGLPVIIMGGSFNNDRHRTPTGKYASLLKDLTERLDPKKVFFVIGDSLQGYERMIEKLAGDRFRVYRFVPSEMEEKDVKRIRSTGSLVRVAIEPVSLGIYKSIAYEIFKRRKSVLLALDGNAAGANLIQEARSGRIRAKIFINPSSRALREKGESLSGYVEFIDSTQELVEKLAELQG